MLDQFQRLACMATTGCMRTIQTAALAAMLDLLPLLPFNRQEAAVPAVRLNRAGQWKGTRTSHTEILCYCKIRYFVKDEQLLEAAVDRILKQHIFDNKYKLQLFEEPNEGLNPKDVRVLTDVSTTKSETGTGVFSEDLN